MKKVSVFLLAILLTTTYPSFAATITGTIKYDGEVPKFKELKMDADPICISHHTGSVFPQTLVLGEGQTLANVLVSIKTGLAQSTYPASADVVTIDQKGCMYSPHVVGVMAGQKVKILNPDGTLHNVHAVPKVNAEFNIAMPKFRTEIEKTFDKAEAPFSVKCDVHPWMMGYVAVFSHPFFSTSQEDGKFTLNNVPAGTYEIEAWHEKLGTQSQKVTVAEGETKELAFTFTKPTKAQ